MHIFRIAALGAILAAAGTTGCSDFLTSPEVARDPNAPTAATRNQLFVAVQAGQFGAQESGVAQFACMIMQQCSGVGGRFVQERGEYTFTQGDFSFDFSNVYIGGGLVDIRKVEASATADNDKLYLGIAKAWEALTIGTAADVWGDIPYREAVADKLTPALDPQTQVYADIQTLLTSAIADMNGGGAGPGTVDLVYGGDKTKWIQVANTLKARYYMHTAEVAGAPAYDAAIAAANSGISSSANDFLTTHTAATSERNIWYQFSQTSFGPDLVAGSALVDLMNERNDPRLPQYFERNSLGGFGGNDVNGATPSDDVSQLNLDPTRRQPLVTWAENQLILAEAKFVRQGAAAALPHLTAVRAAYGLAPVAATLQSIMLEKYVALFQNIEVWSDYKRTCIPALTPAPSAVFKNKIPGRVYYGTTEHNVNPNIPSEADQLSKGGVRIGGPSVGGFRNPNDPNACP